MSTMTKFVKSDCRMQKQRIKKAALSLPDDPLVQDSRFYEPGGKITNLGIFHG
jgi:hypothetical protein